MDRIPIFPQKCKVCEKNLQTRSRISPAAGLCYARFLPSKRILSAIMAMNSLFVGLPLVLDTV